MLFSFHLLLFKARYVVVVYVYANQVSHILNRVVLTPLYSKQCNIPIYIVLTGTCTFKNALPT